MTAAMGRYGLYAVVLGGALLVGTAVWWVSSERPPSPGEAFSVRGGGTNAAGGEAKGSRAGTGAGPRSVDVQAGQEQGSSAGEGATGARAIAGLKPRAGMVGESATTAQEGGTVEVTGSAPAVADRVAALKPMRGAVEQGVAPALAAGEGELPPEIVFDGGQEKRFSTDTQVALEDAGKIAGDSGSMAFWVKPDWESNDQNDAVFVQIGEGPQAIRVAKNVTFLRFEFFDPDGRERGVGLPIDSWKPGEWHQVTGTWVQGRLQLYVDGKPVSENSFDIAPNLGDNPKAFVGSKLPSGTPAVGEMADVRILNRPLQAAEIQELARKENQPQ